MLKNISEYGKWVKIWGYRNLELKDSKVLLKEIRGLIGSDVEIQFFNADLVATWQHLYFAVLNAAMVMETKRNISKSLAVEVLLYASARRQINKAIDFMGINDGSTNVAIVIVGGNEYSVKKAYSIVSKLIDSEEDMNVLGTSELKNRQLMEAFKVTDEELNASYRADKSADPLVEAILERIALLSTQI